MSTPSLLKTLRGANTVSLDAVTWLDAQKRRDQKAESRIVRLDTTTRWQREKKSA